MKQKIRIGCGAGFSGDRLEPALVLAEKGELDYLVLECLAERTIALAQKRKLQDPSKGYDPLLERRIGLLLPTLVKNNVCLITNMGAANPVEGARKIISIAQQQGIKIKVAAVTGDDVLINTSPDDPALETGKPLSQSGELVSANAYMGIEGILTALERKVDIIITGRVADPSLFLAPMIHAFGWHTDNYDLLGKGTVIGHLLECAGHITGGYFADPVKKPVDDMAHLGHPFADVFPDGSAVISKVAGTGGIINLQTAKEQLLYEVINPHEYFTPDVIADFTTVQLKEIGHNQVKVTGGTGKVKPQTYKVSVGYKAFYLGEGEIAYAGPSALERAQLAGEIIYTRLKDLYTDIRIDYLGNNAIHRTNFGHESVPYEIRLRVAAKASNEAAAALVGEELEALYTNGPAGGGGVRKMTNEVIGIVSTLIDRDKIRPIVSFFES
ncbi:acyclic terpene utilization AtuA family protein [Emticicia sp. 17c]|uniref:acyclic terpene utilization AtuA family protein n=1 Tax=Emticicia sp. 17c TaxID=3127704 RepID=UPI00301D4B95